MRNETDSKLIAPCGINCAICKGYLREKNKCPGCRFLALIKDDSKTRRKCIIKNCMKLAKLKSGFCFECPDFPCQRMKVLNKRYIARYKYDTFATLEAIQKKGIEKVIKDHHKKYSCSHGRGIICVHDKRCYKFVS